jgi:hypothetical protein
MLARRAVRRPGQFHGHRSQRSRVVRLQNFRQGRTGPFRRDATKFPRESLIYSQ